jgi:hypothetical protein
MPAGGYDAFMIDEQLLETIKRELPALLQADPALRRYVLELTRAEYADRRQTEDRFDRMLDELRRDREEQARKWDEAREESRRREEEWNRKWENQNKKWDDTQKEQNRRWEDQNRKWDEQNHKWDEQNRKWEASREEFRQVHEEIMAQAQRFDRSIGALGARWGLQSESAFRNALAGILEQSFGVEVLNVNEYDEQGEVFGRPDQVELDVIIKNGILTLCELKSSIDKAGMYIFERKARFYERRHDQKADRLIVVSPMVDPRAQKVAERLGIEVFSDSSDVPEQAHPS